MSQFCTIAWMGTKGYAENVPLPVPVTTVSNGYAEFAGLILYQVDRKCQAFSSSGKGLSWIQVRIAAEVGKYRALRETCLFL